MNEIRVLVVDDEVHARRGLRTLLQREEGVVVVGEAANGADAIEAIRRLTPDLVLLDVEMPDRNGLEVVAEIGAHRMPAVVFVTAYDQYAVAAFEASAVDYLLKPFTDERFFEAMRRVRKALRDREERTLGRYL
jgi:two-component system, LytTR family, response regulator